jgi:hypothetical protein
MSREQSHFQEEALSSSISSIISSKKSQGRLILQKARSMAPKTREASMTEATERHFGTYDLHQNFMVVNQKRLNAACKLAKRDGNFRPKEVISSSGHASGGKFPSKPEKGQSAEQQINQTECLRLSSTGTKTSNQSGTSTASVSTSISAHLAERTLLNRSSTDALSALSITVAEEKQKSCLLRTLLWLEREIIGSLRGVSACFFAVPFVLLAHLSSASVVVFCTH